MEPDEVRSTWDTPLLSGLWARAREALEQHRPAPTFRLELPDEDTREAVGTLYGRPMWGMGTRINVSKLDERVREASGIDLQRVLEILHGRPITRADASTPSTGRDPVQAALEQHELTHQPWAQPWTEWFHQFGRVAEADRDRVAARSAAVLAELSLDRPPSTWVSRAELATRHGDPHQLDSGTTLTRVVLRAAAFAHDVPPPGNERERRALWERCGVTLDAVSDTALCWALPFTDWARGFRERTAAGLPTHLTQLELNAAPAELVQPGSTIAVCENPRVLEAAAQERVEHPLICLSGHPGTVASALLRRLRDNGAALHYHGDLDWSGVAIADAVRAEHGAEMWRMTADDYRESLNLASAERIDLPTLVGSPVETPWDPGLAELMSTAGRAIEEEAVLPTLLDDLRNRRLTNR